MITARRSAWFERAFRIYNRNLLARRFQGLRIANLDHVCGLRADVPLLLYANHSSWWDGLVAFEVGMNCQLEQYVMMEERQLRSYPLFRRLGAFSVSRESVRAARRSVEYAANLLRGNGKGEAVRALWIFPQGRTQPNDLRPFKFFTGAAHVARQLERVALIPVAMRYEYLEDFRPEIFVRIGDPLHIESATMIEKRELIRQMENDLTTTLDCVRADILAGDFANYKELIAPRRRAGSATPSARI